MRSKVDAISKKISKYFSPKKEVLGVYLYGSHASGKIHAASDIDIGVLLKRESKSSFEHEFKYRSDLEKIFESDVDVVILNDADLFLVQQVFTNCIPVYVRNKKMAEEYKWRLIQLSWDYMSVKRIFDETAIQKLKHGY